MTGSCGFCFSSERLSSTENIEFMLREAFKVEVDLLAMPEVCNCCLEKLDITWKFYQQVKQSIGRFTPIVTKQDEIVVKVELDHETFHRYEEELIDPDDLPNEDFSYKLEELEESKFLTPVYQNQRVSKRLRNEPFKFGYVPELKKAKIGPVQEVSDKPKRNYKKKDCSFQKQSRGLRANKEKISFSMLDLFEEEINKQKFLVEPEVLENLDSDPQLWSNFQWNCGECDEPFQNIIDLNQHLQKFHRKRHRAVCIQCQKETFNYGAFLNHAIDCFDPRLKFCCVICSEHHTSFLDLHKHQYTNHKTHKVLFCLYCGLHFFTGSHLKNHAILKHNRVDKTLAARLMFRCDFCGLETILKEKLRNHIQKHRANSYFCDQCPQSFPRYGDLLNHEREFHSTIQLMCNECGKFFKSKKRLRCHTQNVHLKIRRSKCEVCNRSFGSPAQLKVHMLSHDKNAEGSFKCPFCDKKYKYSPGFKYHIRSAHTGEKPYRCPIENCQQKFIDYPNARKHIKTFHKVDKKPLKDYFMNGKQQSEFSPAKHFHYKCRRLALYFVFGAVKSINFYLYDDDINETLSMEFFDCCCFECSTVDIGNYHGKINFSLDDLCCDFSSEQTSSDRKSKKKKKSKKKSGATQPTPICVESNGDELEPHETYEKPYKPISPKSFNLDSLSDKLKHSNRSFSTNDLPGFKGSSSLKMKKPKNKKTSKLCATLSASESFQNLCSRFKSSSLSNQLSDHDKKILERMSMKNLKEIALVENSLIARKFWENEKSEREKIKNQEHLRYLRIVNEKRQQEYAELQRRKQLIDDKEKEQCSRIQNDIEAKTIKSENILKNIEMEREMLECRKRQREFERIEAIQTNCEESKIDEQIWRESLNDRLEERIHKAENIREKNLDVYRIRVQTDNQIHHQIHAQNYDQAIREEIHKREQLRERIKDRESKFKKFDEQRQKTVQDSKEQAKTSALLRELVRRSFGSFKVPSDSPNQQRGCENGRFSNCSYTSQVSHIHLS